MAEEEFQESEVIFSDNMNNRHSSHDAEDGVSEVGYLDYRGFSKNDCVSRNNNNCSKSKKSFPKKKKKMASSVPVKIPSYRNNLFHCGEADDFEEEEDDQGEIVPPHVILGRRITGKMAYSVCTGNGRTLKGRDLSQVRNSILRMTGFLEA